MNGGADDHVSLVTSLAKKSKAANKALKAAMKDLGTREAERVITAEKTFALVYR